MRFAVLRSDTPSCFLSPPQQPLGVPTYWGRCTSTAAPWCTYILGQVHLHAAAPWCTYILGQVHRNSTTSAAACCCHSPPVAAASATHCMLLLLLPLTVCCCRCCYSLHVAAAVATHCLLLLPLLQVIRRATQSSLMVAWGRGAHKACCHSCQTPNTSLQVSTRAFLSCLGRV